MNKKEHKEYQKVVGNHLKKVSSSKKEAQAFLIRAGIHDKNGKLNKHYRTDTE